MVAKPYALNMSENARRILEYRRHNDPEHPLLFRYRSKTKPRVAFRSAANYAERVRQESARVEGASG